MIIAFAAMELCWLALAVGLVWVWWGGGSWPPPASILLASPAGVIAVKRTPYNWRWRRWFDAYRLGLGLGVGLLAASVATSLGGLSVLSAGWLLALAASLTLFFRGWSIGEDVIDAQSVDAAFQVGAAATLILVAVLQWVVPGVGVIWSVGFFLAGLFAIGLARRGERRRRTDRSDGDWLVLTGGLCVVVLIGASLLVGLVSPELLQALVDQVGLALGFVAGAVSSLLAMLGGLSGLFGPLSAPPSPSTVPPDFVPPEPPPFAFDVPSLLRYRLQRLAEALALLLLVYAAYRLIVLAVRRVRRRGCDLRRPRRPAPTSESPPFSLTRWWARLLDAIRAWFRPRRAKAPAVTRAASSAPLSPEQRSIRELYRDFLRSCDGHGFRRTRGQTPNELAQQIATRRPATRDLVDEITRLYVRVRYAERSVTRVELTQMRDAVARAGALLAAGERSPKVGDGRASSGGRAHEEGAPGSAE